MRLLLISDTHGALEPMVDLAVQTRADAIVHAGDFGFYDESSPERLSDRELALRIVHSALPEKERKRAFNMTREAMLALVHDRLPLSDFPKLLSGKLKLPVPLYAVWGNHEDAELIRQLRAGTRTVPQLRLLDERTVYFQGGLRLFGLGGNVYQEPYLLDAPIHGDGGKVATTLSQFARLYDRVKHSDLARASVFVSHVSPGKEAIVRRMAAHLGAEFCVSGHMGSPYGCVWSEFAIREPGEARSAFAVDTRALRDAWALAPRPDAEEARWVVRGLELLEQDPPGEVKQKRGDPEPVWFRQVFHVNLPDAVDGHALLIEDQGQVGLETHSKGRFFRAN